MSEELDERGYFWRRVLHRNYYSKAFNDRLNGRCRIFYKVTEGEAVHFRKVGDDLVLKAGTRNRKQLKATVVEDDRHITKLIIQSYSKYGEPDQEVNLSFTGREITELRQFLAGIEVVKIEGDHRSYVNDSDINEAISELLRNRAKTQNLLSNHPEIVEQIAKSPDLKSDLVAVGYRRAQLERFESMLEDDSLPESRWQAFFDENTWIFGYGLSYQFLSKLDGAKLEQDVSGHSLSGPGKRVDALMKTRGRISSLCFVEIKKPKTDLLVQTRNPYREGAWAPSAELAGAVAQVQTSVYEAVRILGGQWTRADQRGTKTGEVLYNFEPRSILIVGKLDQFHEANGVNEQKYRSFEIYRRNTSRPEILTFDELLERARFIVEHAEKTPEKVSTSPVKDDDPT